MIATFGDLDVRRVRGSGEHSRRRFVVKIIGQVGDGAIPTFAGESALSGAGIAFGARSQNIEWRIRGRSRRNSCRGQNLFQFTRPDNGIDFRNILLNFVAKTFHQTAGDDQFPGTSIGFVPRHFQNCVHRFLLGAGDERTSIDHNHVGIFGTPGQFRARRAPACPS